VKPSKFATKRPEHVPGRTDELEKKLLLPSRANQLARFPRSLLFLEPSGAGFFVSHTHIRTEGAPVRGSEFITKAPQRGIQQIFAARLNQLNVKLLVLAACLLGSCSLSL
jgi:hypothetical protein